MTVLGFIVYLKPKEAIKVTTKIALIGLFPGKQMFV